MALCARLQRLWLGQLKKKSYSLTTGICPKMPSMLKMLGIITGRPRGY